MASCMYFNQHWIACNMVHGKPPCILTEYSRAIPLHASMWQTCTCTWLSPQNLELLISGCRFELCLTDWVLQNADVICPTLLKLSVQSHPHCTYDTGSVKLTDLPQLRSSYPQWPFCPLVINNLWWQPHFSIYPFFLSLTYSCLWFYIKIW